MRFANLGSPTPMNERGRNLLAFFERDKKRSKTETVEVNGLRVRAEDAAEFGGKSPAGASAAKPSAAGTSDLTLGFAVRSAVELERERAAKVFASPHARGRERGCAALLSAPQGWSASKIIAELPHLPTDEELANGTAAERKANSDAVWDRANAAVGRDRGIKDASVEQSSKATATDPWSRAYAALERDRPAQASRETATAAPASNDPWGKAYARLSEERAA